MSCWCLSICCQEVPPIDTGTDTRSRILDTALTLFTEEGMEATSLRRIASELGVTKAALYYYFPSKRDIIQSVTAPVITDMNALMSELEAIPEITPRRALEAYFDFTASHLQIYQMLMRNPGIMVDLNLVPTFMDWHKRFQVLLVGPDASPEQRVRATIAFGGVSDCVVMLTDIPTGELRQYTIQAAISTLGLPEVD